MPTARRSPLALLAIPLLVGCAASTAPAASPAAPSAAIVVAPADGLDALNDEQLVRKFLQVTGAADLGMQVGTQMLESFRQMPNLPPGFIDKIKANLHPSELIELIVPIHLKHLDRKSLLAAIRFYQSPEGQALVKATPIITAESAEAGKVWGMALAEKTLKQLGVSH